MLDERSVQMASVPFNNFENKGNVEVLIQQYAFNKLSTLFYAFRNVERPVQTPLTFGPTKC